MLKARDDYAGIGLARPYPVHSEVIEVLLPQGIFRSRARRSRAGSSLAIRAIFAVATLAALADSAQAGFVGSYAFANFNLVNTNADGSASLAPDGSLLLTGGNTGSNSPGMTDFSILAAGTGLVTFDFSYASLDFPGFDFAGYFLDTFTQLADFDGAHGSASFSVTAGHLFGFRVSTLDNTGEPGVLKISNFNAPGDAGGSVPEPSTALLVLAGAVIVAARRQAVR